MIPPNSRGSQPSEPANLNPPPPAREASAPTVEAGLYAIAEAILRLSDSVQYLAEQAETRKLPDHQNVADALSHVALAIRESVRDQLRFQQRGSV